MQNDVFAHTITVCTLTYVQLYLLAFYRFIKTDELFFNFISVIGIRVLIY